MNKDNSLFFSNIKTKIANFPSSFNLIKFKLFNFKLLRRGVDRFFVIKHKKFTHVLEQKQGHFFYVAPGSDYSILISIFLYCVILHTVFFFYSENILSFFNLNL